MTKKLMEANFQTRLRNDLRDAGWKVRKLQSGMGYTILDFFVTSTVYGPAWIELKTMPSVRCKIPLTALQRLEMRDLQDAGCLAVCLSCVKVGSTEFLFLTSNPEEEYVSEQNPITTRRTGERWNAVAIGARLDFERERLNLWRQRR